MAPILAGFERSYPTLAAAEPDESQDRGRSQGPAMCALSGASITVPHGAIFSRVGRGGHSAAVWFHLHWDYQNRRRAL